MVTLQKYPRHRFKLIYGNVLSGLESDPAFVTSSTGAYTRSDIGEPLQIYPMVKRMSFKVSSVWRVLLGGWVSFLQGYKDLGFSLLVIPAFMGVSEYSDAG